MDETTQGNQTLNWKDLSVLEFPKWYNEVVEKEKFSGIKNRILGKRTRYEDYLIAQLRSSYMDLEGDLRTLIPEYSGMTNDEEKRNADEIGKYILNLLKAAKGILESQRLGKRQMLIASSLLYEVEECVVWITPPALAFAQIPALRSRVDRAESKEDKGKYELMLDECEKILEEHKENFNGIGRPKMEYYRSRIEEIIRFANAETLKEKINTGLQIERLRTLRYWGFALLSILIFIFPIINDPVAWKEFPIAIIGQQPFTSWAIAISFAVIGGIGGFLSGLLQVRGSKTDLGDYEISVLLFQLRPILGAFAALVLVTLMSWRILADIVVSSSGSYILVAFISGFSERYFINLLKLNTEENSQDTAVESMEEAEPKSNGSNKS